MIVICLGGGFVVLIVALFAFAACKPDSLQIQRSTNINASPAKIFALIDDSHAWPQWAAQDKSDPTMQRTYNGAAAGKGAVSDWQSKGRAGVGRMEIVESMAPERIAIKVDFVKPFIAHNLNEFTLASNEKGTSVTWTMNGTNPFIAKFMSLFINIDRMMGKHFEQGLANLKSLAEARND